VHAWITKLTGKEKEEGYRDVIYFSAPLVHDRTVYLLRDEYLIPYRTKNGQTHYNSWRRYLSSIGLNAVEAASVPVVSRGTMYTAGGFLSSTGICGRLPQTPAGTRALRRLTFPKNGLSGRRISIG